MKTIINSSGILHHLPVYAKTLLAAGLTFVSLCVTTVVAAQQNNNLDDVFVSVLSELKQETQVPILLPEHLPSLRTHPVYASASGNDDSYAIRLESDPDCDHANACFLGFFKAKRGVQTAFPDVVNIDKDIQGRFTASTCGGSCSSPTIQWNLNGVAYTVQLNLPTGNQAKARSLMIEVARESIIGGNR